VVGSRFMYLLGCALQSVFTLACGLARTPFQLILFRGFAGIAIAFCLPTAVSLITTFFPHGKRRTWAFAVMGGGQPIGFSLGLVAGGLLADSTATWRAGFYIAAGINTFVLIITFLRLPKVDRDQHLTWHRLRYEIDWPGALLLSCSLGLLSYVLA
jgi:MFS family permease